jgi:hypothetical protein
MVTLALALRASSLTEVAVMTTGPAVDPAVYTVVAALAVPVGLNEPQVLAGVQVQFTPRPTGSPVTVAAMIALAPSNSDNGGAVVSATEITVALIVIAGVLALIAVLVTEVAVMTTVRVGTVAGAV